MIQIFIKIIVKNPATGVFYGLQKLKGMNAMIEQQQFSIENESFSFNIEISVKIEPNGNVDFKGEFVQGPKNQRFIYINVGRSAGQIESPWQRRMKLHLSQIYQNNKTNYEVRINGILKDGSPTCGTIKHFLELS